LTESHSMGQNRRKLGLNCLIERLYGTNLLFKLDDFGMY
jgi:hypothetical protein